MDEIFRNLGTREMQLWPAAGIPSERSFEATEVWLDVAAGTCSTQNNRVNEDDLDAWLGQDTKVMGNKVESLVMRLAWLDVDIQKELVKLSDPIKKRLLDRFGLQVAHKYARTCLSGATAMTYQPDLHQRAYTFCNVPKLAALWSHRRFPGQPDKQPITQGVVFVQQAEKDLTKKFLQGSWDHVNYKNPMFPALMFSLMLGAQIDMTGAGMKRKLQEVETQTGYHFFRSRGSEKKTDEKVEEVSKETSGYMGKLASMEKKSQVVGGLLDFAENMADDREFGSTKGGDIYSGDEHGCSRLRHHTGVLRQRLAAQSLDTEFILKRVQIQIAGLKSIMTLRDSKSNQKIAYYTYRDSSSMKTLAVVTMFFLPGSFISALFSTPCFEWDRVDLTKSNIGVPPTPQFKLYWAITIPLTVLTFILYFWWLSNQKVEMAKMFSDVSEDSEATDLKEDPEGGRVTKRSETFLEKTYSKVTSFAKS